MTATITSTARTTPTMIATRRVDEPVVFAAEEAPDVPAGEVDGAELTDIGIEYLKEADTSAWDSGEGWPLAIT